MFDGVEEKDTEHHMPIAIDLTPHSTPGSRKTSYKISLPNKENTWKRASKEAYWFGEMHIMHMWKDKDMYEMDNAEFFFFKFAVEHWKEHLTCYFKIGHELHPSIHQLKLIVRKPTCDELTVAVNCQFEIRVRYQLKIHCSSQNVSTTRNTKPNSMYLLKKDKVWIS